MHKLLNKNNIKLISKIQRQFTNQNFTHSLLLSKSQQNIKSLHKLPQKYNFSLQNNSDANDQISLDLPKDFSLKDSILNDNNLDSLEGEIDIPVEEEELDTAGDSESNIDSELEIPNVSKSKKRKFMEQNQQLNSKNNNNNDQNLDQTMQNSSTRLGKKDPLWMKFFTASEPLKVDIQRSVKSENNDLIQNYIKGCYSGFTFEQLVICLTKLQRSNMQQKILLEIKQRIVLKKDQSDVQLDFQLLKNSFEIVIIDKFFQQYLTVNFTKNFDLYTKEQQTDIIKYMLIINKISEKIILKYIKIYSEEPDENGQNVFDYLKQLTPESLSYHINVLVFLSKFLKRDVFKQKVPQKIIDFYFELQCKNLQENFTHNSQASYIEMEKLVPQEIPYFLSQSQKQYLKKLIAKKLVLRFNIEETKGRFLHFKKDKTISRFIRNIFEPTDRYILQEVIVLFGNYLLIREKSDYKFDFKLFSYLQRYNLAYKLYLDEALWPIKNLTKAFMNSLKKQGTLDHALAFIVLHKLKIYFALNYETIVQEEQLEYRKNVWNKIIKDNIYNIEEYLSQLQNSNLLDRVLQFPERIKYEQLLKEKRGTSMDSQSEIENPQKIDMPPIESDLDGLNQKQNNYIEEEDNDQEEFMSYTSDSHTNVENKASQLNNQHEEEMIKNKVHKEKYMQLKDEQLEEYQKFIEENNILEFNKFNTKINIHSTIPLKYYINLIQTITSLIYNYNNFTPNFFIILNEFLHKPKHIEIFEHFTLVPGILESFCLIQDYHNKSIALDWLPQEISDKLNPIRNEINEIFSINDGDGQKILKYIENQVKQFPNGQWQRDKAYDEELFYKEIQNHSYFNLNLDNQNQQEQLEQTNSIIRRTQRRDYLFERFVYSKNNLYQKILNSDLLRTIINESHLKKMVGIQLEKIGLQTKVIKNHVQYPCMADFFLEDYKIVIQVLDNQKLVGGVEGIMQGSYQKFDRYFNSKGYKVVYINYKDYDISETEFQKRITDIIFEQK